MGHLLGGMCHDANGLQAQSNGEAGCGLPVCPAQDSEVFAPDTVYWMHAAWRPTAPGAMTLFGSRMPNAGRARQLAGWRAEWNGNTG